MTEKRRKTIVFAIFIAATIWGLYNFPFGGKQDSRSDLAGGPIGDTLNPAEVGKLARTDAVSIASEWGRDPFAGKAKYNPETKYTARRLKLTAISGSNDEYMAIINGKILAVGEKLDGWTVTNISDKTAVLSKDMNTISLSIEDAQR